MQPLPFKLSALCAAVSWALAGAGQAAELPVPCGTGRCGAGGPAAWVTAGAATAAVTANALTVQQTTNEVVLNWESFNVSADGTVTFRQPDAGSIALNRIFQADPSRIFGVLEANGRVFLLNQNGVLFGEGAGVNVGGLLASTLDMTPEAVANGIAGAITSGSSPAFRPYANGRPSAPVVVESGASITTAEGGQVLMFAPRIEQRGSIATPGGQALLAAGTTVYLAVSNDADLRGLLVEVSAADARDSAVTNGPVDGAALADADAQIVAERGNVTLAGLAVNQNGRVSATTSVRQNGSVRLQARTGSILSAGGVAQRGGNGGTLKLGERSTTEVVLSADVADTTVDANAQPRSLVSLVGADVEILDGSRVTATGGDIVIKAQQSQATTTFGRLADANTPAEADASRVYVAPGAVLDASGAEVALPMERNALRVELRGNQLRDSPLQRDGPLRGQAVYVDIRSSGTRTDGTQWQGTPLADVAGDLSTITRSVSERTLNGGNVVLQAQGDVLVAPGAAIDVSGGVARYADGFVNTTQLLAIDGSVVDIGVADPDRQYLRTVSEYVRRHERWGVTQTFPGFPSLVPGTFERGYFEGHDAGGLTLVAPHAILDGDVLGTVARGLHQREPAEALPAGARRPYTQLARGARLVLGRTNFGAPELAADPVRFAAAGSVLPSLLNDQGLPFDPRTDALPSSLDALTLRTELFGAGRFAEASLVSGDSIVLGAGQTLALPAGGALSMIAPSVAIEGAVTAPAGAINLTAERPLSAAGVDDRSSLVVASTARLDTSGRWINDEAAARAGGGDRDPLHLDGGSVSLRSRAGDITLARGGRIDVSAGAHRSADGVLAAGRGGSITLETQPVPDSDRGAPARLELGAELRGYALDDGGALTVTVGEIRIAPFAAEVDRPGALYLDPAFFRTGGFSSYSLRTNRDGVLVDGSASLLLRQDNLQLPDAAFLRPSGGALADFAPVVTLHDLVRRPTDLSLTVSASSGSAAYSEASFPTAPLLRIATGSRIEADADAAIGLRANTRIGFDGSLVAPSGTVTMLLDETLEVSSFIGAQSIRLGESSAIDLRGSARIATDALGARRGAVLDGGALALAANRGYIVLAAGSRIDVSGGSGVLDMRRGPTDVGLTPVTVGSSAGRVALTAAEGIVLQGDLTAHAGDGSAIGAVRPRGGELQVVLDTLRRNDPVAAASQPSLFPTGPRTITLSNDEGALVIGPDTSIPGRLNGLARVRAESVVAAGFDTLLLESRVLSGVSPSRQAIDVPGAIAVDGDVALTLPAELALRAARFDVAGGHASLAAPYVTLGNVDREWFTELEPQPGAGALSINAGFLELTGRSVVDGAASTTLASAGDLRLRGLELPFTEGSDLVGRLSTAGDLTLSAAQVYATTLTDFALTVRNNPTGTLTIAANGAQAKDVLSAASRLRLAAPSIVQGGTLRAPFGSVELAGDSVSLRPGSVLSTSAGGLTVPFGSTQGGFAWAYDLATRDFVYGADDRPPPAQSVGLEGRVIDIAEGATIDLSGGGDLLAYEFVPGVGGSRDVLAASVRPDEFAIVPGLDIDVAPFDPREYVGSPLRAGDSVFLEGGSGLAAGEYVLLPARYSLLPGAFLVRGVGGYEDIVPGEHFAGLDGRTVVAGYRTLAGTGIAASSVRRSGFAVRPAELARREAQYTTSSANEFFAAEAAARGGVVPRLPRDGGVLALGARESLLIDGVLRAGADAGGRGAAVDVSSSLLRIAEGDVAAAPGEVIIDADSLNRLTAESLLLGGRRAAADGATAIDVTADRVTIAAGTSLNAPELLLGARDTVLVEAGARLTGTPLAADGAATAGGEEGQRYQLIGDSALLRVTGGAQAEIARSGGSGARGVLDVRAGATLTAGAGAMLLDASRDTSLLGDLELAGGSLNVGASRITLGAEGVGTGGLVLTADDLTRLDINELVLTSRSTVDVRGDLALGLRRLVIDAAGLRGVGVGRASIDVGETIRLTNTANLSLAPSTGTGALDLRAASFEIGHGAFGIDGFATSSLAAAGALTFENDSRLTAGGDLAWSGGYLTATAGARAALDVTGTLALAGSSTPLTAPADPALGARLDIVGRDVVLDGAILLPGGTLSLHARGADDPLAANAGAVVLGDNALVDVRGRTRWFDGVAVAAPGGRVTLTSDYADVVVGAGATVDVRGADGGGDGGDTTIRAARGHASLAGRLLGHSAGGLGGSLDVDARSFGGYAAAAAHADAGGFTGAVRLRQRGEGDLVVAGPVLRAHDVHLIAEQGSVNVSGGIDANGTAGGRVRLAASGAVVIDGSITVRASGAGQRGGGVELLAESGGALVRAGALIDVAGGDDGDGGAVLLRVPRDGLLATLLDADPGNDRALVAGSVNGARSLTVEAYRVYHDLDGVLGAAEAAGGPGNPLFADAASFMADDGALRAALGFRSDATRRVQPGIEIRSVGDLTLASDWNLFPWRFAGEPAALTLRAAGDLVFDGSLSDGFQALTGTAGFELSTTAPGESSRYRLVAGAAEDSAEPLSVRGLGDAPPAGAGPGDVRVGEGSATVPRMVRTGTGGIEIAAANDLVLGNQQSVIYTAGRSGPGIRFGSGASSLGQRAYPIDGGDLSIAAGRHVRGAVTDQFVNDWLWRVGAPPTGGPSSAVAWTVNFQRFQQNLGALGGGDVRVTAGGDITDLSVSVPSIGRQVGGTLLANSAVEVVGGGGIEVHAAGSIMGGRYYAGLGSARLVAGDAVGIYERPEGTSSHAPLLGLGDTEFTVTARTDLAVDGIVNPSLLPPGLSQLPLGGNRRTPYFYTYTDTAAARLTSVAGDLLLRDSASLPDELSSMLFLDGSNDALALRVAPPTLRGAALSGDVEVTGSWLLFPAPKGNVELFAQNNLRTTTVLLALSDTFVHALPRITAPALSTVALSLLTRQPPPDLRLGLNAPIPVHADANQPDGVPDLTPARLVAATGDIEMRGVGSADLLYFAKPVRLVAGRDLLDVVLQAQHSADRDLTVLRAGRDVRYTARRNVFGGIEQNFRSIVIDGPGLLQVVAGRDVDLQTSQGIWTRGNLDNRFLPAGGASVAVLAGVGDIANLDSSPAVYEYLLRRPGYAQGFMAFVRSSGGVADTVAQAAENFGRLDENRQRDYFESIGLALPAGTDYVSLIDAYFGERGDNDDRLIDYVRSNGAGTVRSTTEAAVEFLALVEPLQRAFFESIDVTVPAGANYVALLDEHVIAPARAASTLVRYVNGLTTGADSGAADVIPIVETNEQALEVFRGTLDARQQRGFFVALGVDLPEQPDYAAFVDEYIVSPDQYARDLAAYVQRLGFSGSSTAAPLAQFMRLDDSRQQAFLDPLIFAEIREGGRAAAAFGRTNRDFTRAFDAVESRFPGSLPDTESGQANSFVGDVRLFFSRVYTLAGGDISVTAPGGEVNVGLATPPTAFGVTKSPSQLGVVVQQTGDVSVLAYDDLQVNESRVFAADGGNILVWSTEGDIDAGRGAKTAISAPPPTVTIDENGRTIVNFPAALTGSGIQTLATTPGRKPGNVDLFAPRGVVNAGDAGIVAGNLTIAATAVLGADNISVSGVSVGVPVDTGGFAAALTGVSAVASSASNAAESTVAPSRDAEQSATPLADQALGFLDVFITGFGEPEATSEEECDPATERCD